MAQTRRHPSIRQRHHPAHRLVEDERGRGGATCGGSTAARAKRASTARRSVGALRFRLGASPRASPGRSGSCAARDRSYVHSAMRAASWTASLVLSPDELQSFLTALTPAPVPAPDQRQSRMMLPATDNDTQRCDAHQHFMY